jgi:chemotaxis protein CheD
MVATDLSVGIGDLKTSRDSAETLVARGLGSCIGVCLVDGAQGVAGLAHVMLPDSMEAGRGGTRYADVAIPALLETVVGLGARRHRLRVALVGGAQMFSGRAIAAGGAVGERNHAAACAALAALGLRVTASATGGERGRTVRVEVAGGRVEYREAGGTNVVLLEEEVR